MQKYRNKILSINSLLLLPLESYQLNYCYEIVIAVLLRSDNVHFPAIFQIFRQ